MLVKLGLHASDAEDAVDGIIDAFESLVEAFEYLANRGNVLFDLYLMAILRNAASETNPVK